MRLLYCDMSWETGRENIRIIIPYIMLMHGVNITRDFRFWLLCFKDHLPSKIHLPTTYLILYSTCLSYAMAGYHLPKL